MGGWMRRVYLFILLTFAKIETIKNPEHISKSYSNREICYEKFGNLYLKVVYKKEDKNIIVITQYWIKGVE